MKLAELQRYFARAATSGAGPLEDLEQVFLGGGAISARERIAIYNRAYYYRLLDALASVFVVTRRLLGEQAFERIGLSYLGAHPSQHPAIERVGRHFAGYLREVDRTESAVSDVAELEWARLNALLAADPRKLATLEAIVPSAFPTSRATFVPSLQLLELDPRALAAFDGNELSGAFAGTRSGVAVWRKAFVVEHLALEPDAHRALGLAMNGATMSDVCAVFDSGATDADARRASAVISQWFARGWIESEALPLA